MNQADMGEIRQHLVDDPIDARRQGCDAFDIVSAQSAKLVLRNRRYHLRKLSYGAGIDSKAPYHRPLQRVDLSGAEYSGVARQDLLQQRGAGARHADDEQRDRGWIAATTFRLHQAGREQIPDLLESRQRLLLIIADLAALEPVARKQVSERPLVLLDIRERLAEREMQRDLCVLVERRCVLSQLLQGGQPRVVGGKASQAGKIEMNHGVSGGPRQRLFKRIAGG